MLADIKIIIIEKDNSNKMSRNKKPIIQKKLFTLKAYAEKHKTSIFYTLILLFN